MVGGLLQQDKEVAVLGDQSPGDLVDLIIGSRPIQGPRSVRVARTGRPDRKITSVAVGPPTGEPAEEQARPARVRADPRASRRGTRSRGEDGLPRRGRGCKPLDEWVDLLHRLLEFHGACLSSFSRWIAVISGV